MADGSKPGFAAFISYSHALDGKLAPALQGALQRFAKPWNRLRAIRVFRDETNLSANPRLWSSIEVALAESNFFILLASPGAAGSEWVAREVAYWVQHKSVDHLLIALTDGEVDWDDSANDFDWEKTTALPTVLREVFDEEPKYVDLRWARVEEHLSDTYPRFRDCVADLAVPLHGRHKDELVGEDVRQHRRTVRLARSAVAVLTALALTASGAAVAALRERNVARTQARLSLSRQLAAQADATRDQQLDLSLLLSLEGLRTAPTAEARDSLLAGLSENPALVSSLPKEVTGPQPGGDRFPGSGIEFSSERRTLAWGTAAGATVLDIPGRRRQQVAAGAGTVVDLAFSPNGRTLALSSEDAVTLWDLAHRRPAGKPLDTHGSLFFSADGQRLAVASDRAASIWDLERHRPIGAPIVLSSPAAELSSVTFSRDLRLMATGDSAGTLRLWNVAERAVIRSRTGHEEPVVAVVFDPAGRRLASAGSEGPSVDGIKGSVAVWDVDTLKRKGERLTSDRGTFGNLAFSPDGRNLAASYLTTRGATGIDGSVLLLDPQNVRSSRRTLRSLGEQVTALAFAPSGRWLASIDLANTEKAEETVTVWDLQRSGRLRVDVVDHQFVTSSTAITPRGDQLAYTVDTQPEFNRTVSRTFVVRPGQEQKPVQLVSGSAAAIANDMTFSHDGRVLATLADDGTLRLWDVTSGQPLGQPHPGVSAVAFHPRALTLAIGQSDGTTRLWDPGAGRSLGVLQRATGEAAPSPVRWVMFSGDGKTLFTTDVVQREERVTERVRVRSWDLHDRRLRDESSVDADGPVSAIAVSSDGRHLGVGTALQGDVGIYGSFSLWDMRDGRALVTQSGAIDAVAFSSDSRMVAVGDVEGRVVLWDVGQARPLDPPVFSVPRQGIHDLQFDGAHHLAIGASNTIVIIDTDLTSWRNEACRVFNRNLTRAEWNRFIGPDRPYDRTCPDIPAGAGAS